MSNQQQSSVNQPAPVPQPGEVWLHHRGGRYVVVCLATREETGREVVVYRDLAAGGKLWSRDLWNWQQMVAVNADSHIRWVRRFEREEEAT